jgi:hypothetical protein
MAFAGAEMLLIFLIGTAALHARGLAMGRFYIVAGMFIMHSPILLASFFADLTRKEAVIMGTLLLCATIPRRSMIW